MICSAVLRLPSRISVLMNLVTSELLYSGSSGTSRFGISRRRGIVDFSRLAAVRLRFRPLRAVLRTSLLASLHADGIQRPANHVIANARQILHAAATDQHERVLLQVVAHTRYVSRDLDAVGEPHPGHLA